MQHHNLVQCLLKPLRMAQERRAPGADFPAGGYRDGGLHPRVRHDLDLAIAFFQRFKGLDEPAQSLAENFNRLPCAQRKARVDHILARRAEVQVGTPRFRQTGTDLRNEGGDHDPILRYTCLQSGDVGAEAGKQIGNLLRRLLRDRTLIGLCQGKLRLKTQHRLDLSPRRKERLQFLVPEEP